MPRNVGKIIREAPPGPEMNEQEFVDTMNDLADDAARWRWLMRNMSFVLDHPVERWTAVRFRLWVDENREMDR